MAALRAAEQGALAGEQLHGEKVGVNYQRRHRASQLMIKFFVFQLHLSHILEKQFRENAATSRLWTRQVLEAEELARESNKDGPREEPRPRPATPSEAASHVRGLLRLSSARVKVCIGLYLLFALKFGLVSLIKRGLLGAQLDWLDCLVVGRLRFPGKANKIAHEIEIGFVILCATYRIYLARLASADKFRFQSIEFMLGEGNHHDLDNDQRPRLERVQDRRLAETGPRESAARLHPVRHVSKRVLTGHGNERRDTTRYADPGGPRDQWIPRPNRSAECWLKLHSFTLSSAYGLAVLLACSVATAPITFGGSITTDFGYELAYPTCVSWVRREQAQNGSDPIASRWVYRVEPPNRALAHEAPLEEVPLIILHKRTPQQVLEWRPYNVFRIAFDVLENLVIYSELLCLFLSFTFLVLLNILDIGLNSGRIDGQLELLIARLLEHRNHGHAQRHHKWARPRPALGPAARGGRLVFAGPSGRANVCGQKPLKQVESRAVDRLRWLLDDSLFQMVQYRATCRAASSTRCALMGCSREQLVRDITRVQVLLHDHFDLVRSYNQFNNLVLAILTLNWTLYTVVLCLWIPSVKNRTIEIEFYLAEASGTLVVLSFMLVAALVHSQSTRLYKKVTRLMALDSVTPRTKLRWTSLMKFYFPKPLFCFTLYGATGVSWLLCLQIVTWVGSAFVLLANFFYTARGWAGSG